MVKVEVIETFSLGRFAEIQKAIIRKARDEYGKLFVGDTFECAEDLAKYLSNEEGHRNPQNRPFVRIIEVMPEKVEKQPIKVEEKTEKKVTTKPKTTKKTIAKKD